MYLTVDAFKPQPSRTPDLTRYFFQ